MTDTFDHSSLPEDELLAAEYALGVLSGADRSTAQQRVARDRAFALMVADWEQRLAPWAAEIGDVAPSPQLWQQIATALPAQTQRGSLWNSLTFWRGFAVAAGALAATCFAALIYLGTLAQQPLVATIEGGGHRHFVATLDAGRGTVAVVPAAFSADATRVPELWLIPPDGKPRPVGLLRADQTVTLALPADLLAFARKDAVLAVSLEPPGGSTTGQPTGPVIATGKLTSL
ncbi:MAG TPA: anti-sigma factor [Pseudolabrys sp.]|nr:anti-sigma factor [Pseudolabrys sp.]